MIMKGERQKYETEIETWWRFRFTFSLHNRWPYDITDHDMTSQWRIEFLLSPIMHVWLLAPMSLHRTVAIWSFLIQSRIKTPASVFDFISNFGYILYYYQWLSISYLFVICVLWNSTCTTTLIPSTEAPIPAHHIPQSIMSSLPITSSVSFMELIYGLLNFGDVTLCQC